jgi:nitrous oxide reductase
MKRERKATLGRRDFLRTLGAGATVAAAAAAPLAGEARADTESNDEKRKSRYQANSREVQTFYRVNRYPS